MTRLGRAYVTRDGYWPAAARLVARSADPELEAADLNDTGARDQILEKFGKGAGKDLPAASE